MSPSQKREAKRALEQRKRILDRCQSVAVGRALEKASAPAVGLRNAEDCSRLGQPKIGMSPAELTGTCWGKPARIVKKTTATGVHESYFYGDGYVINITDGKVTEIVETR